MMNASVAENVALASLARLGGPLGFLDRNVVKLTAADLALALHIKSGPVDTQMARSLSGGNQQKVVIAKWLTAKPSIFILDEPTRGIDVAAKFEIYTIIDELAANGSGILLISSEIEEVMEMCDRIVVMRQGEISGNFTHDQFDKERILRAAFGETEVAA
jgi:ribose transport system ATP-binding protein